MASLSNIEQVQRPSTSNEDEEIQENGLSNDTEDIKLNQSVTKSTGNKGIQTIDIQPFGSRPEEGANSFSNHLSDSVSRNEQTPYVDKLKDHEMEIADLESNASGSVAKQDSESELNRDRGTLMPGPSRSSVEQVMQSHLSKTLERTVENEHEITSDDKNLCDSLPSEIVKESMSNLHMVQMDSDEEPEKSNVPKQRDIYCAGKDEATMTDPSVQENVELTAAKSDLNDFVTSSLFDELPNELINYIFSFLSTQDLGRVSSVCKKFHTHASDPVFWTKIDFKRQDTDVQEVCRVIEQFPFIEEVRLCALEDLSDEDARQILSKCPDTVKSLNIGFQRNLGRDCILAILEYLPNLRQLNMEGCSAVNNNTVTALIKLKSLTNLNISHCSFVDDIHVQLIVSNLPLLEVIDIDGLADVSETAIRRLWQHCGTWLRELHVDGASLTDLAMEFVSRCTELQTFTLSFGDNITDIGLRTIMGMKNLTTLKMRKCSGFSTQAILDCIEENEALKQLMVFDMSECIEFNDAAVSTLVNRCHKLQELCLAWCWEISDAGVRAIVEHCPDMRRLDLTGLDKIKGDAFEATPEKMPELVFLNLGQCNQVNDELLCGVAAKMPKLIAYNYYGQVFGAEDRDPEEEDP